MKFFTLVALVGYTAAIRIADTTACVTGTAGDQRLKTEGDCSSNCKTEYESDGDGKEIIQSDI